MVVSPALGVRASRSPRVLRRCAAPLALQRASLGRWVVYETGVWVGKGVGGGPWWLLRFLPCDCCALPPAQVWVLTMGPDAVTSLVLRMCLEVMPSKATENHLPIILVMHLVMVMRNTVYSHSDHETTALSTYLCEKVQSMRQVRDAGRWLADAMHVSVTALDVRRRITVCFWLAAGLFVRACEWM